jgi:hypothetical protein
MKFLPTVVHAEHRGGFRLHIVFSDASENTIDFEHWLQGPMFEPLKNPQYFQRFFVDGGTVVWPNGADIAPETLYEVAGRRQRPSKRCSRRSRVNRLGASEALARAFAAEARGVRPALGLALSGNLP